MSDPLEDGDAIQVWVGRFPSRERLDAYFEETYRDPEEGEEQPISEFAAGQGSWFYDHDFLERSFSPQTVTDIRPLLEPHSFPTSYIDEVIRVYEERSLPVNTLVLFCGEELDTPRSVSGDDFELHYLGSFEYDPRSNSVTTERMSVIPTLVRLELQTPGALEYQGEATRHVGVDSRGLVIGYGGDQRDQPYLDLRTLPGSAGLAAVQVRIYQDQFEQWVWEDEGRNDLTSISKTILNGERTLPWHQDVLQLGTIRFLWNCFPDAGANHDASGSSHS